MKIQNIFTLCLMLSVGINYSVKSQSDCKVYPSKITDHYTGECKKGLAHGMGKAEGIDIYEGEFRKGYPHGVGTYAWKNGNLYVGEFKKGQKEGKGEFTFKLNGKDSTTVGYWRDDEYIGKENKPPYKILSKTSVNRISFSQTESTNDEIWIQFYQNGMRNSTISNVQIQNSSGTYITQNNVFKVKDIRLPFSGVVRYNTLNTLQSTSIPCSFKFEINQKGKWDIRVNN